MISVELSRVLKESLRYAKEHRHEYLTIEHIFLSILNSEEGKDILLAIGGKYRLYETAHSNIFKSNIPVLEIMRMVRLMRHMRRLPYLRL